MSIFPDISEYLPNKVARLKYNKTDFNSMKPTYFYEKTESVSDIYYITEEIESKEGNKVAQVYGFIADFTLAKNLVKTLNKRSNSNRFELEKVKLMEVDKIDSILYGIEKEGNNL